VYFAGDRRSRSIGLTQSKGTQSTPEMAGMPSGGGGGGGGGIEDVTSGAVHQAHQETQVKVEWPQDSRTSGLPLRNNSRGNTPMRRPQAPGILSCLVLARLRAFMGGLQEQAWRMETSQDRWTGESGGVEDESANEEIEDELNLSYPLNKLGFPSHFALMMSSGHSSQPQPLDVLNIKCFQARSRGEWLLDSGHHGT